MKIDSCSKKMIFSGILFYTLLTILCMNVPFFWDTILTSSIAQWFYDNGIQNGIIPIFWDAGHPPFFQFYLMSMWKIFGKTLMVSHFSMLPFLYIMVIAFVLLMQKITSHTPSRVLGMALFLVHPYILTQSTLISYDIVQVAFYLIFLLGFIDNKKLWLLIGVIGMSACSIRGQTIALIGIAAYAIVEFRNWKLNIFFIPIAILPTIVWNYYHYLETGWIISTPSETWETHREFASFSQVLGNFKGILRTFTDYGSIAVSGLFSVSLISYIFKEERENVKKIFYTTLLVFITITTLMVAFTNPIGHRYFIIIHVVMILIIASQWEYFNKKIIGIAAVLILMSGHFWLYPKTFSNGWDVTLKYLSYEKNRKHFFQYIAEENISEEDISSSFPLFCSNKQTNLKEGNRLSDIASILHKTEFLAYSPVCNDMRGTPLIGYHEIKSFGKGKTAIILYKKNE